MIEGHKDAAVFRKRLLDNYWYVVRMSAMNGSMLGQTVKMHSMMGHRGSFRLDKIEIVVINTLRELKLQYKCDWEVTGLWAGAKGEWGGEAWKRPQTPCVPEYEIPNQGWNSLNIIQEV